MSVSVCNKAFTIPEAAVSICGTTPQSIATTVFTQAVTGGQPPCGLFAIVAALGNWQLTYNLTTCLDSFILINGDICNPGAPYNITVNIPWDDSGNVIGVTHLIQFDLNIGVPTVDSVVRDLATGPFTDVTLTGSLPTGISTVSIRIVMSASPNPEVEAHSTANLTILPLTPP